MSLRPIQRLRSWTTRFAVDVRAWLRVLVIGMVLPVLLVLKPEPGAATHRGMTSSQAFGLWTNINESLDAVARVISGDRAWRARLRAMRPAPFQGKRSADVLRQVERYRLKIDALRRRAGLGPSAGRLGYNPPVSSSAVYLASGSVLNAQIGWLIRRTDRRQLVSQYYQRRDFTGKAPGDVYGLVDLANRRMDAILDRAGIKPASAR